LTNAAYGCLKPAPASRLRRAFLHLQASIALNFLSRILDTLRQQYPAQLTESSLVYPIPGYGAIEIGAHRFYEKKAGKDDVASGEAKFMHIWQNNDGA